VGGGGGGGGGVSGQEGGLPVTGPPSEASLGGPIMGHIGWGGPSMGPTLLFIVVVSPCRCEPLRAGCCGGEGC